MILLHCPYKVVADSLNLLRLGGDRGEERAVVWLGRHTHVTPTNVMEVYEPQQITAEDFFTIPPHGMQALQSHLRLRRLRVVAQLHTHPGKAFHSRADDRWAFVRHEGAFSLVLPYFAVSTTPENFVEQVKIFRLNASNYWAEVKNVIDEPALRIVL